MRRISSDKDTIEHVLGDSLSPAKEAMCLKMWGEGEVGGDGAHVSRLVSMTQVGPHGSCRGDIQQNILM